MKRIFTNRNYPDGSYETIDLAPEGYMLWRGLDGGLEFCFPINEEMARKIFAGAGRSFDMSKLR